MADTSVRSATLLALILLLPASLASAQEATAPPQLGERVRVDYVLSGTLAEHDGRLVVVEPESGGPAQSVALSDINRFEAWRCCNRTKGMLLGALVGVGAALGGGLILQSRDPGGGANMAMGAAVFFGMPIGALVGGAIGGTWLAPHHWVEVPLQPSDR